MKLNEPGVFYHVETPEKAAEAVASAQNANPGIEGWCMIGGWPLFTADALKWPAGNVKVVSVDALPAQLNYLRDGHVEVLLAQDCYGWGYRSVEILLEKIVQGKTPATTRVIDLSITHMFAAHERMIPVRLAVQRNHSAAKLGHGNWRAEQRLLRKQATNR